MELLRTGIRAFDEALGGGLLEDSSLLITYDTYSKGWAVAFEIMRNRIAKGDFGVVINSVLPFSSLNIELGAINMDLSEEGRRGNLAIIDMFASFYKVKYTEDFIYTDESMDASVFMPKYQHLYRRLLAEKIRNRRPIGVDLTIDGMAFLLGEVNFIKIFQALMAAKERARLLERRKRPVNIFLLNRDRVSRELISWIALYSQYVVEFFSSEGSAEERMIIRKSPLPSFRPREGGYRFMVSGGSVEIW